MGDLGGAWPTELRVAADRRTLAVSFDDGVRFAISAELLRVESPSAEVQGHGPGEKRTPAGKAGVRINTIDPVGNYAVRIGFDDGHATGLYGWDYLRRLGERAEELTDAYLDRLRAAGASRDAPVAGRR
ncbi:MAG: DUF971 domain-containing protein [Methylobacteriaceae bacterium]|nr:DUF971 domain-containing protein [Methylobacteriaceae bacterium]